MEQRPIFVFRNKRFAHDPARAAGGKNWSTKKTTTTNELRLYDG